jgi:uncharacterized protein (TIGR02271 family)
MSSRIQDTDTSSRRVVAGYFGNPETAEKAIQDLSREGFDKKNIGVALWQQNEAQPGTMSGWGAKLKSLFAPDERQEYQSHDTFDTLRVMGIPEERTRLYRDALRSGGVLVTVKDDGSARLAEAERILQSNGADFAPTATKVRAGAPAIPEQQGLQEQQTVQLYGEVLRVHKERIQRGEVRVRKEVVPEQQTVQVPVTREEIYIERRPGEAREATGARIGENKELRVPVSEEQVHVEKRPVVREEVEVGKRAVQENRNVTDTVRHEELQVEQQGDVRLNDRKKKPA